MSGSIGRVAITPNLPAAGRQYGRTMGETGRMAEDLTPLVCSTCGRVPQDDSEARLSWVLGVENGRRVWTCDRCSRENLRSIEGKLDSAWW